MAHERRPVLLVIPTMWCRKQIASSAQRWAREFAVAVEGPLEEEIGPEFDALAFCAAAAKRWRGKVAGVFSACDYPGAACAAVVAATLGLRGPSPQSVLGAAHKEWARRVAAQVAPEAVPWFRRLDRAGPPEDLRYPCYVKPVKGFFSTLVRMARSPADVRSLLEDPVAAWFTGVYLKPYHALLARYGPPGLDACSFLAEGVLQGSLHTLEGWVTDGEVGFLGVTDSVLHPDRPSFARFDYPTSLPAGVVRRVEDVAARVVRALGLRWTLFNIEFTWDPARERVGLVEVNPRMAGQFADLHEKVDGVNTYRIAMDVAVGRRPTFHPGRGRYAVASSRPLRLFAPARVLRVPDEARIAQLEGGAGDPRIWVECRAGQEIRDLVRLEDGMSFRYAVLNAGGSSRADLLDRLAGLEAQMDFAFEPL